MPLDMDVHKNMEGLTDEDLKEAHKMNLEVQAKHGVKHQKYWYNKESGTIFCLCEAPSKEAAEACHREAHGNVPDEIIEVH